MKMSIIIILIIIQEISTAHNPQLKARAQCAHRKTQNKYLYKNKNRKRRTEYTMTTTPWTIIQFTWRKKKRRKTPRKKEAPHVLQMFISMHTSTFTVNYKIKINSKKSREGEE